MVFKKIIPYGIIAVLSVFTLISFMKLGFLILSLYAYASEYASEPTLAGLYTVLHYNSNDQILKTWPQKEFEKHKKNASYERDPNSGTMTHYEGLLLSQLIEQSIEKLSIETRALIDLIVFENSAQEKIYMPRFLATKYPILITSRKYSKKRGTRDHSLPFFCVIMPWTSKPKILEESLPIRSYFVKNLVKVKLAAYQDLFREISLIKRTDPIAIRGEKIFIQNCMSCHGAQVKRFTSSLDLSAKIRVLASTKKSQTQVPHLLNQLDFNSLKSYWQIISQENEVQGKGYSADGDTFKYGRN